MMDIIENWAKLIKINDPSTRDVLFNSTTARHPDYQPLGPDFYSLNQETGEVIRCNDWHGIESVKSDIFEQGKMLSTVFFGMSYGYDNGKPILFETMFFDDSDGEYDQYQRRYCTYEEAVIGHEIISEFVWGLR